MPNVQKTISKHNKSVLSKCDTKKAENNDGCNCRANRKCPLDGKCQSTSVIYQATVTRQDSMSKETYIGLTENTFKSRYSSHLCTFKDEKYRNSTALSEYVWKLNDNKVDYSINWKIISRAKPYSPSTKICYLCLEEKYFIIHKPDMSSLNKRNELASGCRHRKKHLLCNFRHDR
jgi:hypothetical protein